MTYRLRGQSELKIDERLDGGAFDLNYQIDQCDEEECFACKRHSDYCPRAGILPAVRRPVQEVTDDHQQEDRFVP